LFLDTISGWTMAGSQRSPLADYGREPQKKSGALTAETFLCPGVRVGSNAKDS